MEKGTHTCVCSRGEGKRMGQERSELHRDTMMEEQATHGQPLGQPSL